MTLPDDHEDLESPEPRFTAWCWVIDRSREVLIFGAFAAFFLCFFVVPMIWVDAAKVLIPLPLVLFLLAFAPSRVVVAADGIQWVRLFALEEPTFVGFAEVSSVAPLSNGAVVALRDGRRVMINVPLASEPDRSLRASIGRHRQAWSGAPMPEFLPALVGEPHRSTLTSEQLLAIATSPKATVNSRIAALRLLGPLATAETRSSLEGDLGLTASPAVARALREVIVRGEVK